MSLNEIANQLVTPGKGIMAADRPSPAFRQLMESEGLGPMSRCAWLMDAVSRCCCR